MDRAALVDRVVALAVREGLKDEWTVHGSALTVLDLTHDPAVLRRARARVSDVVLRSPSLAGTRAVAALNVVLARLEADVEEPPATVPTQRVVVRSSTHEPHLSEGLALDGSTDSIGAAAVFVSAHVCAEHGATISGRAMLLAQELLAQTVGRTSRPAGLVVTCNGYAVTVYVDLAPEPSGREQLTSATPDLTLVQQLADDWGAECLRPGVRYWALLDV